MISIIIIVKNDPGIKNTLESLQTILCPDKIEIIIVDASKNRLDNIFKDYKSIRIIKFVAKNNKTSIPEQRNIGIKNAKGKVIVFLDANCIPDKRWLQELYKYYYNNNELIVSGRTIPTKSDTVNTISNEKYKQTYLKEAPTINLLFSRKVFDNIGYFDENFTYGSDTDITWRAVKYGIKIKYADSALVYHDWGNFKEQLKRMYRYGTVRPKLYIKNKYKLKELLYGYDIIVWVYPLFIILTPLLLIFPYYPLLIVLPLLRNIKNKPVQTTVLNFAYGLGVINGIITNIFRSKKT